MISNEDVKRILKNCKKDDNLIELISLMQNLQLGEQELYWSRFYSFSTIHAGLFVLYASNILSKRWPLVVIGVTLGFVWLFVQILSLRYVDRAKKNYHDLRDELGLSFQGSSTKFGKWLYSQKWSSSTNISLLVTLLVTTVWIVVFIFSK